MLNYEFVILEFIIIHAHNIYNIILYSFKKVIFLITINARVCVGKHTYNPILNYQIILAESHRTNTIIIIINAPYKFLITVDYSSYRQTILLIIMV